MFWNKDKIPDNSYIYDEDLFRMDDEDIEVRKLNTKKVYGINKKPSKKINFNFKLPKININKDKSIEDVKLRRVNIIVTSILVILGLVFFSSFVDIILVTRFNKTPLFSIRKVLHNDGGTIEYYGIGYKAIKYDVTNGRKDLVIGNYSIKYNTSRKKTTLFDLSLTYNNDFNEFKNSYLNKYIEVEGALKKAKDNSVVLEYVDEDGKYSIELICNMNKDVKAVKDDIVTVTGTLYDYSNNDNLILYMNNCDIGDNNE